VCEGTVAGSRLELCAPSTCRGQATHTSFSLWGGGDGDASAAAAGVGRGGHIGVGRCMVNSDGRVHREDREVRPTIHKCILSITHQAILWLWSQLRVFRV